jgi:hypothetical protein
MDDRYLLRRAVCPSLVRAGEFSRLGKSVLAYAYERLVPIVRVTLRSESGSSPSTILVPLASPRKAVVA